MSKLICLFLLVCTGYCGFAGNRILPLDPSVRTGKLANGMTYYIRQNKVPEGRACFYLVQNVGSLLENDRQNGLAHFLEHMAFNGSVHFPGKSMIEMLERHGVAFGRDINAYTSLNETIYGLNNVPSEGALTDSCLMVLYDWACGLTLDSAAVDTERPVILEEWRTRRNADFRLSAKTTPVIYEGSQYAKRDIIGDTAVIGTIRPPEFHSFYRTWYRTDLQSVIVVGDFDAAEMELKINSLFNTIPVRTGLPARPYFEIPLDRKMTFVQALDPEATETRIEIRNIRKIEALGKEAEDQRVALTTDLFNRLMRERIFESFRKNKVRVKQASIVYFREQPGYNTLIQIAVPQAGYEESLLEALTMEKERVKRFGFTPGEMDRVKTTLLRETTMACKAYEQQTSAAWVEKLSRHFLENNPVADPRAYLEFINEELPLISSDELRDSLCSWDNGEEHCVISVTGPVGMTEMTGDGMKKIFLRVRQMELQPFRDSVEEYTLLTGEPEGGKIEKEKPLKHFNATEWLLSNGRKVIFRPMKSGCQVSIMAYSKGGISLCDPADIPAVSMLPAFVGYYGVGALNSYQLNKILSDRDVECDVLIKPYYAGLGGQAPADETETLLQMLWLRLQQPRFDTGIHEAVKNKFVSMLNDRQRDTQQYISDTLNAILGNNSPYTNPVKMEAVKEITVEQIERIYKKQFDAASDFNFLIVGDIDVRVLKPLVEKYIGSLSKVTHKTNYRNISSSRPDKILTKEFVVPFSTARSTVIISYAGKMKYTPEHEFYNAILKEVLETRSMQRLRVKEGATYQVVVQQMFETIPSGKASLMLNFDCAPGREQELINQVYEITGSLAEQGPTDEEVEKAVKKIRGDDELQRGTNSFWINGLFSWGIAGANKIDEQHSKQYLKGVTGKDIQRYVKKFITICNHTELVFKSNI